MSLTYTRVGFTSASGNDFGFTTFNINMKPRNALVLVSISGFGTPGGDAAAGILEFTGKQSKQYGSLSNVGNIGIGSLPPAIATDDLTNVMMLVMAFNAWTTGMITVLCTDFSQYFIPQ